MQMSENAKSAEWYVVHTYSGYENKVKTNLENIVKNRGISHLIQEIKVPTELVQETNSEGVTKESEAKVFPSYVFVKMIMSDATWHIVRNITGSAGFVGPEGRPVALTAKEVEKLGIESVSKTVEFKVGDSVRVGQVIGSSVFHLLCLVQLQGRLQLLVVLLDALKHLVDALRLHPHGEAERYG